MNRWEKEVLQSLLASETEALKELENQYEQALSDINRKVRDFQAEIDLLDAALNQDGMDDATKALLRSRKQSKIYQQQYQEALQGQISGILDKLHGDSYSTMEQFMRDSYENGYVGTMYDIAKQGIPVIMPIDQKAVVRAVLTDSKVSGGLYARLGVDIDKLKKSITQEISRGIATDMSYNDIARNIANVSKAPLSRAKTIARTEGGRIQNAASRDAALEAKEHGADLVKIWDATLDGKTRPSHQRVDGEIREIEEKFSNGLMYPGDPAGGASEVVNCRCREIHKPRWDVKSGFTKINNFTKEDITFESTKDYADFKKKYWSKENLEYMQYVSGMEQKYGTKKWETIMGDMTDTEYQKFKALEEANPMFKSYASNEKSKVQYKSTVASPFVKEPDYRKLFNGVDESPRIQRVECEQARAIVSHRSGTKYEDMAYINAETGKHLTRTDYDVEGQVIPNKPMREMLTSAQPYTIISVHNHPGNAAPSMADIDSAYSKKYKYGIIACHNGYVFKYHVKGKYDSLYVDMLLDKVQIALYNKDGIDKEALQQALKDLESNNIVLEVFAYDL